MGGWGFTGCIMVGFRCKLRLPGTSVFLTEIQCLISPYKYRRFVCVSVYHAFIMPLPDPDSVTSRMWKEPWMRWISASLWILKLWSTTAVVHVVWSVC